MAGVRRGDESPGQEHGYRWNGKGFRENQSVLDGLAERVHRAKAADDRQASLTLSSKSCSGAVSLAATRRR